MWGDDPVKTTEKIRLDGEIVEHCFDDQIARDEIGIRRRHEQFGLLLLEASLIETSGSDTAFQETDDPSSSG